VTVALDRILAPAERETLITAFRAGDAAALRKAIAAQPNLGYVEGGSKTRVPVRFAFPRCTGDGKILTIVCSEPIVHIGGDKPDAKPKAGFNAAFLLLVLDARGKGTGEIAPAAHAHRITRLEKRRAGRRRDRLFTEMPLSDVFRC
jgi:hypothetical protein